MVKFYHMHPELAETDDGTCRAVGQHVHHSSCALHGFTHDNESKCELREGEVPIATKCKCTHDLPAALVPKRLPEGVKRVPAARRKKKAKASPKRRKAKAAKKKRKARK